MLLSPFSQWGLGPRVISERVRLTHVACKAQACIAATLAFSMNPEALKLSKNEPAATPRTPPPEEEATKSEEEEGEEEEEEEEEEEDKENK